MYYYELSKQTPEINQLLLLADPDLEMIEAYVSRSSLLIMKEDSELIGVCAILPTRPCTFEIMNIAIKETHQGLGLGTKLLQEAIRYLKTEVAEKVQTIEIATGNSSLKQLYLYQKLGFRLDHIEHDFFVKNYPEPIYENGLQCCDLLHLSLNI